MSTIISSPPITNLTNLVTGPASITVLTSAQLLALTTTPITLIPAQGPNTVIMLNNGYVKYNYKTVAYTINGATLQLQINGVDVTSNPINPDGILNQTQNILSIDNQEVVFDVEHSLATLINQPVKIINTGGALTDGNGTLEIGFFYNILTFNS